MVKTAFAQKITNVVQNAPVIIQMIKNVNVVIIIKVKRKEDVNVVQAAHVVKTVTVQKITNAVQNAHVIIQMIKNVNAAQAAHVAQIVTAQKITNAVQNAPVLMKNKLHLPI